MFSNKQKHVLFGSEMRYRPQYVRVPLQMVNGVRELKTDLNFSRIKPAYDRAAEHLASIAHGEPILHIRTDCTVSKWLPEYEKICAAFRSVNGSRVLRRMQITGFRLVNMICKPGGYRVMSDAYICGLDCACVIFNALTRLLVPSGRVDLVMLFDAPFRSMQAIRSAAIAHDDWRNGWTLTLNEGTKSRYTLNIRADRSQIIGAANIVAGLSGTAFQGLHFRFLGLSMDFNTDLGNELYDRYGETDINVLLSGYRIRRFQRFGRIVK